MNLISMVFGVSIVLTVWHLIEEFSGKLWRYFGAIAGVRIPDLQGIIGFTLLLGLALLVAAVGILGMDGRFGAYGLSLAGVGFLLGGRVSDWWNSHYKLQQHYKGNRGFHGNPGLLSSWFYLADAALLIYLLVYFWAEWTTDPLWWLGLVGLLLGVGLFYFVIGGIRWFEKNGWFGLVEESQWKPNQPIPDWAK